MGTPFWTSAGVIACAAMIVIWAVRAFARGFRSSRQQRLRWEVLMRLATAMRAAAERDGQRSV